jgi:hypothetical protein
MMSQNLIIVKHEITVILLTIVTSACFNLHTKIDAIKVSQFSSNDLKNFISILKVLKLY